MPAAIAIPAIATAISGGAAAGASIYGAHKTASAAKNSAKLQTDAANHAADVEGQSARDALEFQKQEAARKAAQDEADRKGNYDQWAAFMNAHNAARARYGYSQTAIPGYVPGVPPTPKNGSPGAALMGQGGSSQAPPPVAPQTSVGASLMGRAPQPGSYDEYVANGGGFFPPGHVGLPPQVPAGSVPINGGINPNAYAYQTPDGRIVRGMRTPMAPPAMRTRSVGSSLMGVA